MQKKLNFTDEEFNSLLNLSPKKHTDYPTSQKVLVFFQRSKNLFYKATK